MLNILRNKNIAFLENGSCLEDECELLADWMRANKIGFKCIFDVEEKGLFEVLKLCRDIDVIIFQSTFTYPVSQELKKAFLSITNPEYKKTFIEVFVYKPTFERKPKTIHDIYVIESPDVFGNDWQLYKLNENEFYYNTRNLW